MPLRSETTTHQAVAEVFRQSSTRGLLSTSRAARWVRCKRPDCELTDKELAELIALLAMRSGYTMFHLDEDLRGLDL
jgi:hypothetical protein